MGLQLFFFLLNVKCDRALRSNCYLFASELSFKLYENRAPRAGKWKKNGAGESQ